MRTRTASFQLTSTGLMNFLFKDIRPRARCKTIISKSDEKVGNHDFFSEWFAELRWSRSTIS
jgi:hypothetical protein